MSIYIFGELNEYLLIIHFVYKEFNKLKVRENFQLKLTIISMVQGKCWAIFFNYNNSTKFEK